MLTLTHAWITQSHMQWTLPFFQLVRVNTYYWKSFQVSEKCFTEIISQVRNFFQMKFFSFENFFIWKLFHLKIVFTDNRCLLFVCCYFDEANFDSQKCFLTQRIKSLIPLFSGQNYWILFKLFVEDSLQSGSMWGQIQHEAHKLWYLLVNFSKSYKEQATVCHLDKVANHPDAYHAAELQLPSNSKNHALRNLGS